MKRSIAIAAVAVSAVLAGGTALAFADDEPRTGEAKQVQIANRADDTDLDDRADEPKVTASHLTVAQAIDAALKSRPGTVLSADLDTDDDDGDRGWEVEILASDTKTYEIRLDPATGKILTTHTDPDTHRAPHGLTAQQAAESAAPKGTVVSVDFDEDHGGVWEVETRDTQGKEHDWDVDTKTGKVTADRED
ncbi:PepSY domain-containing protein [Streptomyces roseirectus]|uniref:PepSY domain-containing protein n=1 Tax=Streptomyces roseirectus TaxID=2768066 RepID=A0A7H0IBG5_9ACTN|nr:PepSY domain-containing protein [Streptomyces roseirectus]QNP70131.1 PepSY domain-containing protein [Streptomyces roseirectus]